MDDKTYQSAGISQADFEAQRRVIALSILEKADQFIAWDLKFNEHLSNLAEELVKQLKANPRILESQSSLRDALRDIQASGKGPDLAGGDILGGDVLDEIWGVIKDILTGEKDFVKEIIKQILGLK